MSTEAYKTSFPALRDARYPVHKIADQLEPYLYAIVERFHPEKIILFGSHAYGSPTEHSDVDLLIVREDIPSGRSSNLEIRQAFSEVDAPPMPFTLLSRTPAEIAERIERKSPFYEDILRNGVELYAA